MTTNTPPRSARRPADTPLARPDRALVDRALARSSVAVLATVSPTGQPHAATVVYATVDGTLYVSTRRGSRKARNLAADARVHVCVPVRRAPFVPPSTVQFASTAELLAPDHPDVRALVAAGRLKAITGHGELDLADGCIVRIAPPRTYLTYGLGLSLRALGRNPLDAAGRVEVTPAVRRPTS